MLVALGAQIVRLAIRAAEEAFLPAEHLDKYADSIGHQPQQHKART